MDVENALEGERGREKLEQVKYNSLSGSKKTFKGEQ